MCVCVFSLGLYTHNMTQYCVGDIIIAGKLLRSHLSSLQLVRQREGEGGEMMNGHSVELYLLNGIITTLFGKWCPFSATAPKYERLVGTTSCNA